MDFEKLLDYVKADIDAKDKTVDLKLGPLGIKHLSYAGIPTLCKDANLVGDILRHCFIDRRVMHEDMRAEIVPECLASLKELVDYCDKEAGKFGDSKKERDRLFADILKSWKSAAIDAIREFEKLQKKAQEFEAIGRSTELDSNFVMKAADTEREGIPPILGEFRCNTYPIVSAFISLLPDNYPTKVDANRELTKGKNELVKLYDVSITKISDAVWEVQLSTESPKKVGANWSWLFFWRSKK